MKNVTITVDEEVARWARIRAAELSTSVSRMVGEMLRERMRQESAYAEAMRAYLSHPAARLRESAGPLPSRQEIYERSRLR